MLTNRNSSGSSSVVLGCISDLIQTFFFGGKGLYVCVCVFYVGEHGASHKVCVYVCVGGGGHDARRWKNTNKNTSIEEEADCGKYV